MSDAIDYYLKHDDSRTVIAENGHRSAHNGHTYLHRAIELIGKFETYNHESGSAQYDAALFEKFIRTKFYRRCLDYFKRKLKLKRNY